MNTGDLRLPSGYVITLLGVLLTAAISFNAWAVASMYERPTEKKVVELIRVHSPYAEDRKLLLESLRRIEKMIEELQRARTDN